MWMIRIFILTCLMLFVDVSFANQSTPILYTTIDPKEPLAPAYLFNSHNSVGHGTQRVNTDRRLGPPQYLTSDPVAWTTLNRTDALTTMDDCNLPAMVALTTPAAVVNYLKTHAYNSCLQFLWTYSTDLKKIFIVNNLNAVLNEIARMTPSFVGTNAGNMQELLFFVR
ncbi:MAG TPA: hypothetical protein VHM20_06225, partial [Gammaproteobacteria bacterium]|nr:hypothetical protein [Gammaproteobacteria bacterium]